MAGDLAIVGSPFVEEPLVFNCGAANVFRLVAGVWTHEQYLCPPDLVPYEVFGAAVDTDGTRLLVGTLETGSNGNFAAEPARVFEHNGSIWVETASLLPAGQPNATSYAEAVSISGDWAAVAAHKANTNAGEVHLFERLANGTWEHRQTLTAPSTGFHFGSALDLDASKLLVGHSGDSAQAYAGGAAHLYALDTGIWSLTTSLRAADQAAYDYGGGSVSLSGDIATIGAREHDLASGNQAGAAYAFRGAGEIGKFSPAALLAADYFGSAVATNGEYVVVGADGDDGAGAEAGTAYFFALPPTSQDASYTIGQTSELTFPLSDLTDGPAIDYDDADIVGALTLGLNDIYTYIPVNDFVGSDVFTFVGDRFGAHSVESTVTIHVFEVPQPPVAVDDSDITAEDNPVTLDLLVNDTDPNAGDTLTITIVDPPQNGSTSRDENDNVVYLPNADYEGPDTFTYRLSDGMFESNVATVFLTVTPVNDAPVAINDSVVILEDRVAVGNVRDNDSDDDSPEASLSVSLIDDVGQGSLTLNADGSFDYTPNADFIGVDHFSYELSDGDKQAIASVTILILNAFDNLIAFAQDPDDADDILSQDDTLTLVFESETNMPLGPDLDKTEVDQLIDFRGQSLGADYSGWWENPRTLVLTVDDATGGDLDITKVIGVHSGQGLEYTSNETLLPEDAMVQGDWGTGGIEIEIGGDVDRDGDVDDTDYGLGMNGPGLLIPYNGDDDNGNESRDLHDAGPVTDDDLVEVYLLLGADPGPLTGTATLQISSPPGAGAVAVWRDADKTNLLFRSNEPIHSADFDLGAGASLPSSIYLEGLDGSAVAGDLLLTLTYVDNDHSHSRYQHLTVVQVGWEVDLDEDGDIDDDDELRENDGDGLFVELGHTRNVGVVAKPSNLALGHIRLTIDSGTAVVDILSSGGSSILDGVLGQELPHALDSQLTLEQAIDSVVGAYGATQGNFFGDSRILIEFLHETHTLQRDSMNYSVFSADPANSIDIDIDSNNDGVVDSADDLIEDQAAHSGQFLRLNDRDLDSNGQPDWFDAKFGVDVTQPRLTKVYLSISPNVDLTGATLRFDYDAEDPANGDDSTPGYFHPNDDGSWGKLRLYDGQGGFIPSNAAGDIQFDIPVASLGFGNARTQILYLEAIDGSGSFGDAGITVSLIFDNMAVPASSDTILATSYRTRLLNRDDSGPFAAPSFQPRTVLVNRANTFTQSGIDPPDYADLHGSERFTDVNFIFGEELADAHDPLIEILATNQSDPVAVANLSPGDDFTPAPGAYRLWSEDGWRSRDHLPYATSGDWVENGTVLNRNQYPSAHFLYSAGDHGIGLFVEGVRDGVETITARMHLAGAPFDEAETTVAIHNFGMILEHNNSSSNVAAVRKTRQVLAASSADPTFTIPPQTTPHSSDRVAKITWSTEIPADGKMEIRVVRVEGEDDISVEKDDAGTDLTPKNWDLDKTKEPTPIPMPMTIYASGNSAGEHKISLWYQEAPKTFDDEIITSEPYMVDERIITVEAAIASITAFKAVPKGCSRVVSVDVTTGVEWTFKIDGGRAKITGHESSTITPVDSLTITPTASPVTIEITGTEADAAVDDSKLIAEFAGANIAEEDFTVVDVLLPSVTAIPVNGTISLSATVSPANPGIDIEFEVSTDAEFVPSASTKTIPDPPGSVSLEIKGLSASPAADDAELSVKIDGIACGIERFTVIGVTLPEIAPIVVGQEREVIVSFSPKAAGVELGLQLVNNDMATDPPKATNEATSKAGYVTDPAEDPRPSLQTFDSGDDDQTLIIAGQTASADAGDVSLALIVDGEILDASPFTVIEVNVPAIGRMIPRRINAEYYEISVFPVLPDGVSLELVLERIGGTEGVAVFISDDDELSSITVEGSEPSVQIAGIEQSLGMLNNIRLSASLSMDGTPCDSVDFTIAAHPVNFRLDSHSKTGLEWETLLLTYLWDSDSGVLEDLDKVWVGEYVSYDNWGQPPNPPWRGIFEDPTISPPRYSRNGSDGGLYDFHTPPGNLLPVSVPNDEFVATQNYGFRDFRTNPGTNNSFELLWQSHILGPLEIIRKVESGRYYLRKPSVPDGVISVILP